MEIVLVENIVRLTYLQHFKTAFPSETEVKLYVIDTVLLKLNPLSYSKYLIKSNTTQEEKLGRPWSRSIVSTSSEWSSTRTYLQTNSSIRCQ